MRFSKRHWCYVIKLIYWCYFSADFRLVESGKKRCISFNNTYSLMVRGNSVSFVVSENTRIRNSLNRLTIAKQSFFLKMDLPIILYRNTGGPSSLQEPGRDSCLRAVLCYNCGYLQKLIWDVIKRFFFKEKEKKCYVFKENRLTLLPCCILCCLPASRAVLKRFRRVSAILVFHC